MLRIVPAENLKPSKIMIVGEAPGEEEEKQKKPFVGYSGSLLTQTLFDLGIERSECCVSNVVDHRPPGNDFGVFYEDKARKRPTRNLLLQRERLRREVNLVRPNVFVACGAEPLRAAMGEKLGITKYRGSVLWSDLYSCKVIPVFHPAYILRNWPMRTTLMIDFERVKEHGKEPTLPREKRELKYTKTFEEACNALRPLLLAEELAFDIETQRGTVTHIAFSGQHQCAFSIPFCEKEGQSVFTAQEEFLIWKRIRDVLESPVPKVAQNAQYDITFLRRTMGIRVNALHLDTMCAHHVLFPEFPKDLGFLCSLYIEIPYYKDELHSDDPEVKALYNAKDACVTLEISKEIKTALDNSNLTNFYYTYVHSLLNPLMDMQCKGFKLDLTRMEELKVEFLTLLEALQLKIDKAAGHEVNPNSAAQVKKLLYQEMGLPPIYKRGTSSITTNKEALEKLQSKTDNEVLRDILQYRKISDRLSVLKTKTLKGRMHTSYNVAASIETANTHKVSSQLQVVSAPVTGRLSSSSDVLGYGTNLQNITPKMRCIFIPDTGYKLLSLDLSQAEARVMAYVANETEMIAMFERGESIHMFVASKVFNISMDEVVKGSREYDLAKRLVHGTNYGMEAGTFSAYAEVSYLEAVKYLDLYNRAFPAIKRYHNKIEKIITTWRPPKLTTPVGRQRVFYGRPSKKAVKEALAYIPQSTIADILNLCGIVRLPFLFLKRKIDAQVLLQVHDEVVLQFRESEDVILKAVEDAFDYSIQINGKTLKIPYEVNIGDTWEQLK